MPCDLATDLLHIFPRAMNTAYQKYTFIVTCIAALFMIAKVCKQIRHKSPDAWRDLHTHTYIHIYIIKIIKFYYLHQNACNWKTSNWGKWARHTTCLFLYVGAKSLEEKKILKQKGNACVYQYLWKYSFVKISALSYQC